MLPTGFDLVENGNVLVSDLSPSVWRVVVLVIKKNPQFVLVFINNGSRVRAENCQLLDLMTVVAAEMVTSAQRSDVTWGAEAIV